MDKKLAHTVRMPIRWGDMDAFGHVNNTVFFRYMEQARIEWMEVRGMAMDGRGDGPVVVNARCTFLRQLKYPGEVEVRTFVASPGRSSFETIVEICRTDQPDVLVAEGGAKVVWVNYAEEKSVPLPQSLREMLET
ncbi:thioesterase family protein [Janthinobacterium sp. 17J80-10]|uniref:acyl-CoA thioesterase n=1 Tax=Janthinobacterium sp. 17J80-10 TaxID=2497863 RepID=UPI00100558B2|nr:thioesterase family protein [Janthinobacterium sp. 17J80-10]QAU34298.1 acyl-CoA thioesterase [Janthinobacterium sp. 17J80-10]